MPTVTWINLLVLIGIGIWDAILYFRKEKTLSQHVFKWCGKWGDAAILCGSVVLIWWIFGPEAAVPVMDGVILGHLFWQE